MSASSESALRASAIIIGYSFAISDLGFGDRIVCAPPQDRTSGPAGRRAAGRAPHGDLFWTYYYGKRLNRQSHGQRVVVTNTRSAVANRDAPHPAGRSRRPQLSKGAQHDAIGPPTTPLVSRRGAHAFSTEESRRCRRLWRVPFRARACTPARTGVLAPSLTIGSKKTSSCSCLAASRRMLPPCDGSSRAAASPGSPPWAAAPRRWACCIGS